MTERFFFVCARITFHGKTYFYLNAEQCEVAVVCDFRDHRLDKKLVLFFRIRLKNVHLEESRLFNSSFNTDVR